MYLSGDRVATNHRSSSYYVPYYRFGTGMHVLLSLSRDGLGSY